MRAKTVVIGVGNPCLSDDGIAGRVLDEVARQAPGQVEIVHAGLPGPRLIDLVAGRRKAIIVDAVDAGGPPGTVWCFRPDEAVPVHSARRRSLHQVDVLFHLKLAEALGCAPDAVLIVGVQPHDISPGEHLSPGVEEAIPKAAKLILAEIRGERAVGARKTRRKEVARGDPCHASTDCRRD